MTESLLAIKELQVSFHTEAGPLRAIDGVSFSVKPQEVLGIVGESGCGKSVTAMSILRLLPKPAGFIEGGGIEFKGQDLARCPSSDMFKIRGKKISMIFQEPMTALNPVYRISRQLAEVYQLHFPHLEAQEIEEKSIQILQDVGIPEPRKRLREYPHQLSGGMRQRVMIAIALACEPELLIADEPTTALDVTTQAQILDLIHKLRHKNGMAMILITHDLGVIAESCEQVLVMYAGKVVEKAPVRELFKGPKHPYTRGLLKAIPALSQRRKAPLATIEGTVPSLAEMPAGCRFANRCPLADQACRDQSPPAQEISPQHFVHCYHWEKAIP